MSSPERPLTGRCIVTTRDAVGPLDDALVALGAEVVHLPLIEITPPSDGGAALDRALGGTAQQLPDWVVVTSRHGAAAVGARPPVPVRTAAVGRATAGVLERAWGRAVDLVPEVQHAVALVEAFAALGEAPLSILVAQADRAEPTLVEGLRELGHRVEVVTAYRTITRTPDDELARRVLGADAVTFASGSAALAWATAFGTRTPAVVCAIGPSTARVAREHGLQVTVTADEHSVDGLVRAVVAALAP